MESYLKDLVAMPTISTNQKANNAALDYLQSFFENAGLHCMRYSFNGYGSLVANTKKDNKTPKVLLAAHLDVVPGPEHLFELRSDDKNYYGRGVFDMKMAIASYMEIVSRLGDDIFDYDLGIMITTEEELGGLDGVARLVDMGYRPEVCILPDGGDNWQIETFAKGFMYITITATGKAAHGSRPWEGDSASFKIIELAHELKNHFEGQTLDTNTINIGMMGAGAAKNQIPPEAYITLDVRYLTANDREQILGIIDTLCEKYDATCNQEPLRGYPCVNEISHPLIQPFSESILKMTGTEASGIVSYGATDARFFAGVGVPCIITRPPGGEHHADGEWISKEGCLQYPNVIIDYLQKIARTGV